MTSIKKYNPAFDFMKCMAAIMITNSHYTPLYEGYNTAFATLGVHGNALFFFVSGYFLLLSLEQKNYDESFGKWYQQKIKRLWLPIIVLAISVGFWQPDITWIRFMPTLWFVKCFLISFPIIFFIIKIKKNTILWGSFIFSILLTIGIVAFSQPQKMSIFHYFHYFCYFPIMLLGVIVAKNRELLLRKNQFFLSLIGTILFFGLYFVIMKFGKGHLDNSYYIQLFGYIPLILFLIFIYRLTALRWMDTFSKTKYFRSIKIVATLTLEIYIVQRYIITDKFNVLFPLNTIIVFILIVMAAYAIRAITVLFEQMIIGNGWNLKKALYI